MENKPTGLGVFLIDNYLNTQTEITESFFYDFTVDPNVPGSIAEDRFNLMFGNTTLGIEDNRFGSDFRLFPNPTNGERFSIKTPSLSGEVEVEITSMLGRQISVQTLQVEGNQVKVTVEGLSAGVYVVNLAQGNQSFNSKLIVQ